MRDPRRDGSASGSGNGPGLHAWPVLAGLLLLCGCVSDRPGEVPAGPGDSEGSAVTIQGFEFRPASSTVRVGAAVVWTNRDPVAHTVTADDRRFDSEALSSGETFRLTPSRAGDVSYFCQFHPFMRGALHVTE